MNRKTPIGAFSAVLFAVAAPADVTLAPIFTDNMVLQREMPAPVWGKARPGEEVTVLFEKQSKTAKAGSDGKWIVKLDALNANAQGSALTVRGSNEIVLNNVLVGEVWLCSGQSNMEMGLSIVKDGKKEVAEANYPDIRVFHVENYWAPQPEARLPTVWTACSPKTVVVGGWGGLSAAGYFFSRELHKNLDVPIGLIESDWGGTPAEAWTGLKHLEAVPSLARYVEAHKKFEAELSEAKCLEKFGKSRVEVGADMQKSFNAPDPGVKPEAATWQNPGVDLSSWESVKVPSGWFSDITVYGAVWHRRAFDVPAGWAGEGLVLNLGVLHASAAVYFNGAKLVSLGKEEMAKHRYAVPGKLVKAGSNTIAVRAFNGGGFLSGPDDIFIAKEGDAASAIKLSGEWKRKIENALKTLPKLSSSPVCPEYPEASPAFLYNAMIAPLIPYGIRGVIWYQGEGNASKAHDYRTLFPTLIKSWRDEWGQGAFPFYFVQLANFRTEKPQPSDSDWAELREAQWLTCQNTFNTGMAVAIDIGDANDVHAQNKRDVGHRLALVALAKTYGKNVECSGPAPVSMRLGDGSIRVAFAHADGLNTPSGGPVKGFALCGADRKFVWADAKIEGATVVVSSPEVKAPVAVRYAWADNPACNLRNQAGLPAVPFRTDDFPGQTEGR